MLTITRRQLDLLAEGRGVAVADRLLAHMRQHFPVDMALLGRPGARLLAMLAFERARRHRLETVGEACRYLNLMLGLGSWFDEDPLLPWAGAALALPEPAADRMAALEADALPWFEAVQGPDGSRAMWALLRVRKVTMEDLAVPRLGPPPSAEQTDPIPDPERTRRRGPPADRRALLRALLVDLHPEKVRIAGMPALEASMDAALGAARRAGLDTPEGTALWAGLAFVLGAGFMRDPAHPWAAAALATPGDAAARTEALRAAALHAIEKAIAAIRQAKGA